MKSMLSPKEAAIAIGVSESSLKRWADEGRLQTSKTLGGHRRITVQEVIRFARASNLPIQRPQVLGLPGMSPLRVRSKSDQQIVDAVGHALNQGDAALAQSMLIDLFLSGRSLPWIFDEPITKSMHYVGELWKHDRDGIFIEHRALDICVQSVNLIRSLLPQAALPTQEQSPPSNQLFAIGGAPSGDPYILSSMMACCVLLEMGYRAVNLGGDTPLSVLARCAQQYKPTVVWISFSSHTNHIMVRDVLELANELDQWGVALVVGGQSVPKMPAALPRNLCCGKTMTDLQTFARGMQARMQLSGVSSSDA